MELTVYLMHSQNIRKKVDKTTRKVDKHKTMIRTLIWNKKSVSLILIKNVRMQVLHCNIFLLVACLI